MAVVPEAPSLHADPSKSDGSGGDDGNDRDGTLAPRGDAARTVSARRLIALTVLAVILSLLVAWIIILGIRLIVSLTSFFVAVFAVRAADTNTPGAVAKMRLSLSNVILPVEPAMVVYIPFDHDATQTALYFASDASVTVDGLYRKFLRDLGLALAGCHAQGQKDDVVIEVQGYATGTYWSEQSSRGSLSGQGSLKKFLADPDGYINPDIKGSARDAAIKATARTAQNIQPFLAERGSTEDYDIALNLYLASRRQQSVVECLQGLATYADRGHPQAHIDTSAVKIIADVEKQYPRMRSRSMDDLAAHGVGTEERGYLSRYAKVIVRSAGLCEHDRKLPSAL